MTDNVYTCLGQEESQGGSANDLVVAFDYQAPEHVEHYATLTIARDAIRQEMANAPSPSSRLHLTLSRLKTIAGHGLFLKWLTAEFGWSIRTAQNFMKVAEVFGDTANTQRIAHLEPTTLYLLAAPKTPDGVREEVLSRFDAGEKVSADEIKRLLRQSKGNVEKPTQLDRAKAIILILSSEDREHLRRWLVGDDAELAEEPAHADPEPATVEPEVVEEQGERPSRRPFTLPHAGFFTLGRVEVGEPTTGIWKHEAYVWPSSEHDGHFHVLSIQYNPDSTGEEVSTNRPVRGDLVPLDLEYRGGIPVDSLSWETIEGDAAALEDMRRDILNGAGGRSKRCGKPEPAGPIQQSEQVAEPEAEPALADVVEATEQVAPEVTEPEQSPEPPAPAAATADPEPVAPTRSTTAAQPMKSREQTIELLKRFGHIGTFQAERCQISDDMLTMLTAEGIVKKRDNGRWYYVAEVARSDPAFAITEADLLPGELAKADAQSAELIAHLRRRRDGEPQR